jgi:hypothetical protein
METTGGTKRATDQAATMLIRVVPSVLLTSRTRSERFMAGRVMVNIL